MFRQGSSRGSAKNPHTSGADPFKVLPGQRFSKFRAVSGSLWGRKHQHSTEFHQCPAKKLLEGSRKSFTKATFNCREQVPTSFSQQVLHEAKSPGHGR